MYRNHPEVSKIADDFHHVLYPTAWTTRYMGIPTVKSPLDLWVYQEILFDVRPDLIIECGTYKGGTTLFLAHLMDALGHGMIVSLDPDKHLVPRHSRIIYINKSSLDQDPGEYSRHGERILVILDSDHSASHVAKEIAKYSPLVSVGSYLIVEDTDIAGHPIDNPEFPGDPWSAVQEFINSPGCGFEIDRGREKYFVSQNPCGYLKRVR